MADAETKRIVDIVYGKDKEAKVLRNMKRGQANAKREFLEKYPDADVSKFKFEVRLTEEGNIDSYKTYFKLTEKDSFDITSDTFLNNKIWKTYLTSNKERGFGIWFADGTVQPYKKNTTTKDINKFKLYVTEDKYFEASLPPLSVTNTSSADHKKNLYLIAIIAACVSTYVCGISTQHLEFNEDTPGIITSMVRYHLYYQISKFLREPSKLDRYISHVPNTIKKHKPTSDVQTDKFYQGSEEINMWLSEQKDQTKVRNYRYSKNSRGYVTGITYQKITGQSPNDKNDYKMFIATTTDGLTKIGQKLLQQSIESYVYAVLGAQAKTRWSIVGEGAKSLQTQEVFCTIVKETIAQSDTTITISNMRTAIASTNVVLNMAISPGMILVPSNLIHKEKIPGYNNVLTLATNKMKFGENTDVNYKAPIVTPKATQASPKTTQVNPKTTQVTSKTTQVTPKTTQVNKPKTTSSSQRSVVSEIVGVTMMIGGFLFSKYIL